MPYSAMSRMHLSRIKNDMAATVTYTVGQVNKYIRNMFAQDEMLRTISVKGEISGLKFHSSGHIYFSLKDETGVLACVMWRSDAAKLSVRPKEGDRITAGGSVEVYERDGKYQLYVRKIEQSGIGELYEKFEALKAELSELGMFAEEYKKEIPSYPKVLGVVTAGTGAAVRDIITVAKRRNPYIQIIVRPSAVQGEGAAESIASGIRDLEAYGCDVMIVGRGGGSIEDLWAFNEREVAQAIFDCSIPIISAVGHEVDFTIADFVADLRAATPSAAAEIAVPEVDDLLDELSGYGEYLDSRIKRIVRDKKNELASMRDSLERRSPQALVRRKYDELEHLRKDLERYSPANIVNRRRDEISDISRRLKGTMPLRIKEKRHALEICAERLKGLSPSSRLKGGYAYISDGKGKAVKSVKDIKTGDGLKIYVSDGRLGAKVTEVEDGSKEK